MYARIFTSALLLFPLSLVNSQLFVCLDVRLNLHKSVRINNNVLQPPAGFVPGMMPGQQAMPPPPPYTQTLAENYRMKQQ